MNPALRLQGLVACVLIAACAGSPKTPPPEVAKQSGALIVDPSLTGLKRDGANATAVAERPSVASAKAPVAPAPVVAAAAPIAPDNSSTVPPPPVRAAAKPAVVAATIEKPTPKIEPPVVAAKKPEPTLDMAALKARLRDTSSIGVFTKLALKSQVDDLIKQFRAHYQNGKDSNVAALRQPYDMLVLKVLALVQDNDPSLAREIAGSREAIWLVLADPQKFNTLI